MKFLVYLLCFLVFFEYLMDIVRAVGGQDFSSKYYKTVSDNIKKMSLQKFFKFKIFSIATALIVIFISVYVAFNIEV